MGEGYLSSIDKSVLLRYHTGINMPSILSQDLPQTSRKPPVTVFLAATVVIFFCTLSALDSIDFVPCYIDGTPCGASAAELSATADTSSDVALASLPQLGENSNSSASQQAYAATQSTGIEPVRLIIPAADIDLPIQNPSTTDVDALDNLLKNGPAHYIDSADLGEAGNVIIFAHSSHLPIVTNKMFQAFNNVPNLDQGDSITVVGSDGQKYLYTVDSVVKATTDSGTTIDTSASVGQKLTLVTCDTLTGVSARFVLTADYVGVE